MPTIRHPVTGATTDIPEQVVKHWTTRGGWDLATDPTGGPRTRPRKPRPRKPRTVAGAAAARTNDPPTVQGGDQGDPATDSPITEHSEE